MSNENVVSRAARQARLVKMARDMDRRGEGLELILARVRELDDSPITALKAVSATQAGVLGLREAVLVLSESPTWADRRENLLAFLAADEEDDDPESAPASGPV